MKGFNAEASRARGKMPAAEDSSSVANQKRRKGNVMNEQDWDAAWGAAHDSAFAIAKNQRGNERRADEAHPLVGYPTADVWIEAGHYTDRGAELRLSFAEPLQNGYADFWVPISAPGGSPLFWLRFALVAVIKGRSVFAATEARPANEPAPPAREQLLLLLNPLLAGFAPPR